MKKAFVLFQVAAGYGSEENYMLLEEKKVTAFVKYNLFDKTPEPHLPQEKPICS